MLLEDRTPGFANAPHTSLALNWAHASRSVLAGHMRVRAASHIRGVHRATCSALFMRAFHLPLPPRIVATARPFGRTPIPMLVIFVRPRPQVLPSLLTILQIWAGDCAPAARPCAAVKCACVRLPTERDRNSGHARSSAPQSSSVMRDNGRVRSGESRGEEARGEEKGEGSALHVRRGIWSWGMVHSAGLTMQKARARRGW